VLYASTRIERKKDRDAALVPLVFSHGTKLGTVIFYLQELWGKDPSYRVLIFSQFTTLLKRLSMIFNSEGIENVFMEEIIVGFDMMCDKILRIFFEIFVYDSP
jgi:SNF2 family DNA or RNA helicase